MQVCNKPQISIVIPVHNQSVYTRACLESLAVYPPHLPYEIVVVDDGSMDDTPSLLSAASIKEHRIRSVRNDTPLGFAGACNRGAAEAIGSLILFLNNDTELLEGWSFQLVDILQSNADIGIVGPKLIFPDQTIQHCGKVWSDLSAPHSHPHHIYYRFPADHSAVNKSRDFQLITGACMLVRSAEFKSLGGFDELYENGWEDDDLCYKYSNIGKRIFYCPQSVIIHHQNKTLNERMYELDKMLPSSDKLSELDRKFEQRVAEEQEFSLARHVQTIYAEMETELLRFRRKFEHNRNRLLRKWGSMIKRDDYIYCNEDGVQLSDALSDLHFEQTSPSNRNISSSAPQSDLQPIVSIVVLTINRLDVTKECIASIQRHTPECHEIIFVDNGSTDGSSDWLRETVNLNPSYSLIENESNLGFSHGCNQGILAAKGEYVLLLNNDTVVTPEWLTGLLECFSADNVGIVGPMTNNISGIQQWPWANYETLNGLDSFAREHRTRYRYRRIPCRRIVGFCMLFRRDLVDRIGLLDEQFGSGNFEDDDYCLRSSLEGYSNFIAGDVFIHHVGSASFIGNRINYSKAIMDNQSIFNSKWSRPIEDVDLARKIVRLKTLEKAERQKLRGEVNEAVDTLLHEGISQIPDEPEFYIRLAKIFLEAGMTKEALDVLSESSSQDLQTLILKTKTHLALGRNSEVLQLVNELSAIKPESSELYTLQGEIHLADSDLVEAGIAFEKALADDPGSADAYSGLASLAETAGEKALALDLLERAALLATSNTIIRSNFLRLANETKEYAKAERFLEEARHFYPDDIQLTYDHIDILLKQNHWHSAMAIIEHTLADFRHKEGFIEAALSVRKKIGSLNIDCEKHEKGKTVSLCMIVKNEEQNLPRCLASLKPIVDEIIIVDTGSTDRTIEIAQIYGAEIFETKWTGDYASPRNLSLEKAKGNWILVMDADEVISAQDRYRFNEILDSSANKLIAFTIVTRNYTNNLDMENWQANRGEYPMEEAGRGWMPSDKVRLFPNSPSIRFENPIHEMVEPSLARLGIPDARADIVVHHYGYMDEKRQTEKKELYYKLGKKKLAESGETFGAVCELAIQAAGIGRYDEAIDLWNRILAIDPNSHLAHFNIGYGYLQKGMFQKAKDASRRAMELKINHREAIINYSICELCLGNVNSALQTIEGAMPANGDYPSLQLMRGIIQACIGQIDSALSDFENLRDSNVEFNRFIHETATKLILAGRVDSATNLVKTASIGGYCLQETVSLIASQEG